MSSIWAAFVLDLLAGDPYRLPHPVRMIGRFISFMENVIRKGAKSPFALKIGGVFLTLSTVAVSYALTFFILAGAKAIHVWLYHGINILLLYTCLAARCLADEGIKIYRVIKKGDMQDARKLIGYIVGRDTDKLDEKEITRAAVETIAENTSDGIIAPLFYMFIGGAPLAMAYKAINTLDSMVGYKNEKYLHLGWASAKLDDVANFVPARITGFLMVASAFLYGLNGKKSFEMMMRDRKNHSSPNCGYPEGAAAGALGVQLGGTNSYFGRTVQKPTIGEPHKALEKEDIKRSIGLMYMTTVIAIILFSSIYWILEK